MQWKFWGKKTHNQHLLIIIEVLFLLRLLQSVFLSKSPRRYVRLDPCTVRRLSIHILHVNHTCNDPGNTFQTKNYFHFPLINLFVCPARPTHSAQYTVRNGQCTSVHIAQCAVRMLPGNQFQTITHGPCGGSIANMALIPRLMDDTGCTILVWNIVFMERTTHVSSSHYCWCQEQLKYGRV